MMPFEVLSLTQNLINTACKTYLIVLHEVFMSSRLNQRVNHVVAELQDENGFLCLEALEVRPPIQSRPIHTMQNNTANSQQMENSSQKMTSAYSAPIAMSQPTGSLSEKCCLLDG